MPTVALDTFRELDKFRAYCELMSEADVLTRIVEVTVEGLARKYDWSWHKAKRFLSTLVSSGLGAVSSLNGEQTATPTATLQVDFSRLYEASRRPQRQRDGDPESPESDLHNMEHAPARGSILKELKNKNHTPLEGTKTRKAPIPRAPIPEDFQPNDKDRAWFRKEFGDISEKLVAAETAAMIDWHISKGNLFADHHAAWKTWMRNWRSGKFARNNVPPSVKSPLRQLN